MGFPVAQTVKNLPAAQEMWVPPLGWEDPLEKGTATHSSVVAWSIPWTEEPGGLQSVGHKEWDTTERLTHTECKYGSSSWAEWNATTQGGDATGAHQHDDRGEATR